MEAKEPLTQQTTTAKLTFRGESSGPGSWGSLHTSRMQVLWLRP